MADNIGARFLSVVLANTRESRRAAQLAALTDIPAASWQKALEQKQKPTLDMLQWVARLWPNNAFWLITGVTDARGGHVSTHNPGTAGSIFPERRMQMRNAAKPYLEQVIHMFRRVYGEGLSLHERREFDHEDTVRLLSLELARVTEDEVLAKLDDQELTQELADAAKMHRQSRGKTFSDILDELGSLAETSPPEVTAPKRSAKQPAAKKSVKKP